MSATCFQVECLEVILTSIAMDSPLARMTVLKQRSGIMLPTKDCIKSLPGNMQTMDWVPIVLVTFKVLVFGTGMFFAVKWHYDKETKDKKKDKREVLRAVGKAAAIFVLGLFGVALITFALIRMVGLNLPST
jgi:hypothetical protein